MDSGVTGRLAPEPTGIAVARVLAGGLSARIRIDPNVRLGKNRTFSGFEDCDRVPVIGEHVTVYEDEKPADAIEGPAVVTGIDEGKRLVYLEVAWDRLHATGEPH